MDAAQARVIYLSSFEYPSTHGHPLHALSMARAFHEVLGDRFLFVIGGGVRHASLGTVPHASPFGAKFSLLKLLHLRALGSLCWLLVFLARHAFWRRNLVVFTNDLKLAAAAGFVKPLFGFTLIAEAHGSGGAFADGLVRTFADRIVCVTEGLRRSFGRGAASAKCFVRANAVDVDAFRAANAGAVRQNVGIPSAACVIGYIGRFRPMASDKGVHFLIDALAKLPAHHLLLVGGTADEIAESKARAQASGVLARTHFVPLVPFDERYPYFLAADLLAYVPPTEDRFMREETSPMKLFEYMAAGRPILASDFPAFREALKDDAFFVAPGSIDSFAEAVARAGVEGASVALRAQARAESNSWRARAHDILYLV